MHICDLYIFAVIYVDMGLCIYVICVYLPSFMLMIKGVYVALRKWFSYEGPDTYCEYNYS